MTWLAWRQLRMQAAVAGTGVAVLAAVLALTGGELASLSQTSGDRFLPQLSGAGSNAMVLTAASVVVLALPALIGMFWGAPLVARELESGTHRLVWNQSVTRSRWLATKVAMGGAAALAVVGALSLTVTWWAGPIDTAIDNGQAASGLVGLPRVSPWAFETRGIAPVGYAAFAFALGVASGLVLRRTVPAMAVTLGVLVTAHVAMPPLVRAHLGPVERTTTITADNLRGLLIAGDDEHGPVQDLVVEVGSPGAWVVRNETVDAAGRVAGTLPNWVADCGGPPGAERPRAEQDACYGRLASLGYRQQVAYQPADRYWTLQAYETAIFLGLGLALIGFSFWWLRRRLT